MAEHCPSGIKKAIPWSVVLALVAAAVGYGANQTQVIANDKKLSEHDQRIQRVERAITQQGQTAAVLDERTKRTQRDVSDIKDDIKDVLKALRVPRDPAR